VRLVNASQTQFTLLILFHCFYGCRGGRWRRAKQPDGAASRVASGTDVGGQGSVGMCSRSAC
jgi:hypothetical protein